MRHRFNVSIFLAYSLLLLACNKSSKFTDEYRALIGEWECIDGGIKAELRLKKSGHFEIQSAYSRNYKFKVIKDEFKEKSSVIYYKKYWSKTLYLYGKKDESFGFRFNDSFDTIIGHIGDYEQSNDSLESRVRFIRKR